ncbi:MAG: response regulator [Acidimicrobiia bacterium]|nr:response regulator [Acidimicrobiia bacterium]
MNCHMKEFAPTSDPYRARREARLLVVDDEPANLLVFEAALEPLGYDVVYAADARGARRSAKTGPFDLVLLDVSMPGESGIDLCRSWRSLLSMGGTPIVLVTALKAADHRTEGLRAGADDFLEKPVDLDMLTDRVVSWIARGRADSRPDIQADGHGSPAARMLTAASEVSLGASRELARAMARVVGLPEAEMASLGRQSVSGHKDLGS